MALPNPKKGLKAPEVKKEIFVTTDANKVAGLVAKGFHVADQKPIDDVMTYTFAEPKSEIEKA